MEQKETKLTEQEIQTIQDLRTQYANATAQMGQLAVERMLVNQQLKRLNELEEKFQAEYLATQANEEKFAKDITEKYGNGDINLETGVFTAVSPSV
jgi:uncharacterized protein YnzC (UPF0291/DUF896 family)